MAIGAAIGTPGGAVRRGRPCAGMHAAIGWMRADVARWHVAMPSAVIAGHDDALLLSQGDGWCCDQQRRDCERLENISHFPTPSVMGGTQAVRRRRVRGLFYSQPYLSSRSASAISQAARASRTQFCASLVLRRIDHLDGVDVLSSHSVRQQHHGWVLSPASLDLAATRRASIFSVMS